MHDVARREKWPSREVPSKGGKRGMRTEYQPPPDIQRQIDEIEARNPMRDSRSDAAIRFAVSEAPNPDNAYEAMRRIRDATDLVRRLAAEVSYEPPESCRSMLLELLVGEQITELAVRRVLEHLKNTLKEG